MTRHHYIPISILSTFASAEAWRVVKAPSEVRARIALADENTINYGQVRSWPVVVYEKEKHKLTRKLIGQVCSQAGLYGIVDYNDRLARALFRFNLQNQNSVLLEAFDLERFMQLGDEPLDPDLIEKVPVGEIDSSFGTILPLLRNGQELGDEQIDALLRFVAFARFRTPAWRRVYFPELYECQLSFFKGRITALTQDVKKNLSKEWGISFETVNKAVDEHFYHMAMMEYSSKEFSALSALVEPKVKVLHIKASLPFITCDNPSRPFYPKRIRQIFDEPLPGFKDSKVYIVYPVSPRSCILISSNSAWVKFEYENAKEETVRAINTALAIMADKEIVFSGPKISGFEDWLKLDGLRPVRRP